MPFAKVWANSVRAPNSKWPPTTAKARCWTKAVL